MKKRNLNYSILALALFSSVNASAQQAVVEEQKPVVVEEQKSSVAEAKPFKLEVPKFSGFANIRYQYNDKDDANSFDVRRARLSASGKLHPKLEYKIQAEYETSVKILDAYFIYKVHPAFNVQVGQYKAPFAQESYISPTALVTIDNHTAITKLNGYKDVSGVASLANGRDVGIQFQGGFAKSKKGFNIVNYKVGVYNGSGINTTDNNKKKDVGGNLVLRPIEALSFSGGYYEGSYFGANPTVKGDETKDDHVRNRANAGVKFDNSKLLVQSEYIYGHTSTLKGQGAYLLAAYTIKKFQPLLSYDYYQNDIHKSSDTQIYQVGLNFSPIKYFRIQGAYTHEETSGADGVNKATVQATFQF
ncbi:MAG: OprO/OprP family phosphate-selective porin [Paludibacteraceae bacterium]|nr:OprO/OprP family phosphate-selective porin [Paludibacteraceae bacterium]